MGRVLTVRRKTVELGERKLKILTEIVEEYIRTGDPVGSKSLSELTDIGVSPATIRNEMAGLFALGLLEQPHTSAGRIPSQRGLRLYIDCLMETVEPDAELKSWIDGIFDVRAVDMENLLERVSEAVADITGCAVVTTSPTPAEEIIDRAELIKIAPYNVVVVITTQSGEVYSKNFRLGYDMTAGALEYFSNWLMEKICGMKLVDITQSFMQETAMSAKENILLFTPLLAAVYELVQGLLKTNMHLYGNINLLSYAELRNSAFDIFRLLNNEKELQKMFNRSGGFKKVNIGKECHRSELADASVVVQEYRLPNGSGGVIGVIGPIRQDYRRILPCLEYFASRMGKIFDMQYDEDSEDTVTRVFRPKARLEGGFGIQ